MKRTAQALALAAALNAGCVSTDKVESASKPNGGAAQAMKQAPSASEWRQPNYASAKSRSNTPRNSQSDLVLASHAAGGMDSSIRQVNHSNALPRVTPIDGAVAATGALVNGGDGCGAGGMQPGATGRTSVRFSGPSGMKVAWFNGQGINGFSQTMVEAPGRYNFPQAAVYRLKLSDFPNRPGVELYPTLEVVPASNKTGTFLAHSAVPIGITEEDLEQVAAGNFVVKVIYLPDPAYQDLAASGPDEIVSSRLEPGVDPVAEATRRGSVLLIFRLGNIDLEAPNSPRMDSPPGAGCPIVPRVAISGPVTVPNGAAPAVINGNSSSVPTTPVLLPPSKTMTK